MAIFEEASPICRGKNLSWETVLLFFNSIPKHAMPKADFNSYVESKINAWTQTHSQIARQLAFYYEENGICYPRFTQKTSLEELFEYMKNWATKYFIPNPYAPSLKGNVPTCIYSFIVKSINEGRNDFDEILDSMFQVKLSSHDKVNVFLSNFTDLLIDSQHQVFFNKGIHHYETELYPEERFANDPKQYFEYFSISENKSKVLPSFTPNQPLQQIFYGAPGTGKSYKIDEATRQAGSDYVFRTTFHPDSDYSTFVGAYKPTMVRSPRYELCGSSAVLLTYNQKPLMENKIEYHFVKQAFTKAYIKAWKEFAQPSHTPAATPVMNGVPSASTRVEVNWDKITWVLKKVEKNSITIEKHEWSPINKFRDDVLKYWEKEFDSNLTGQGQLNVGNGAPFVPAACIWFYNNYCQDGKKNKEECLNTIMNELEAGRTIKGRPNSKTVCISLDGDKVCFYIPEEDCIKPQRITIKKTYESSDDKDPSSVQSAIAAKLKTYNLPFDEAWDRLAQEVNGASDDEVSTETPFDLSNVKPVYLIIEEINRGNCAQIFGDLFQLLDRSDYGFSCYPILSDEDIRQCLTAEDKGDDPSFGVNGLSFTEEQAAFINSALKCDADDDVAEKIAQGEVLVLPPNLYIWATMNTSDQSLFPIDSAFKRRWDWTYTPIKDHREKDYRIKIGENMYDWWGFVQKVNRIIASMTSSADKQLGYFFCKADANKEISADKFVSKVLFYLWNDVFKDYGFEDASLFRYADDKDPNKTYELTFPDFYDEDGLTVNVERVADFIDKVLAWDDNQQQK